MPTEKINPQFSLTKYILNHLLVALLGMVVVTLRSNAELHKEV